jgi:hypothetical protein
VTVAVCMKLLMLYRFGVIRYIFPAKNWNNYRCVYLKKNIAVINACFLFLKRTTFLGERWGYMCSKQVSSPAIYSGVLCFHRVQRSHGTWEGAYLFTTAGPEAVSSVWIFHRVASWKAQKFT